VLQGAGNSANTVTDSAKLLTVFYCEFSSIPQAS